MKILFVNIPYAGHVIPTLGLAAELLKRGHQVAYILSAEWENRIKSMGITFISYHNSKIIEMSNEMAEACYSSAYFTGLSTGSEYELLIYEAWFFLGEALGKELGIPTVRLFSTFALNKKIMDNLLKESKNLKIFANDEIREWHTKHLISEIKITEKDFLNEMIYNVPNINIVFTSKYFQLNADEFGPNFYFVGASVSQIVDDNILFDMSEINMKKPIIYISLGTIYNKHIDFYKECIKEFANKHYTVIISLGDNNKLENIGELPENVYLYNYVPQKEILKRAVLFISHGGMNSINESLYFGVPMIIVPQDADQPLNSMRVVELNLGICISEDEIKSKVYPMAYRAIEDNDIRRNIINEQKRQIGAGGIIRSAEIIENSIEKNMPKKYRCFKCKR